MIYQFTGSCNESPEFQLDIGIDAGHTFWDFHQALQSTLGFQPFHLANFHISGEHLRHKIEISQLFASRKNGRLRNMHNTLVGEIMQMPVKIICYVYDYLNDYYIKLKLTGTSMENNLREPSVTLTRGDIPVQAYDELATGELFGVQESKDPSFGLLNDYYEIFGEMEEYVT
jgi:hypothetical protein